MSAWDFADKNAVYLLIALYMVGQFFVFVWSRLLRHLNLRKNGWPPPHCDAEGDFREPQEKDEEAGL